MGGSPNDPAFIKKWKETAKNNRDLFNEVFDVIPNNFVTTFDELLHYPGTHKDMYSDPTGAKAKLENVKGYLVEYPTTPGFLAQENFFESCAGVVEQLANNLNFFSRKMRVQDTCDENVHDLNC